MGGKRRYDRKQSGLGGQTKPVFKKKAKTTKKIVLRLQCNKSRRSACTPSSAASTSRSAGTRRARGPRSSKLRAVRFRLVGVKWVRLAARGPAISGYIDGRVAPSRSARVCRCDAPAAYKHRYARGLAAGVSLSRARGRGSITTGKWYVFLVCMPG